MSLRFLALPSMLLVLAPSACTLLGAGVGAGIDSAIPGPHEAKSPALIHRLEPGERVVLGVRSGAAIEGRYRGMHGPTAADPEMYLLIESGDAIRSVRASDVAEIGVEVAGKGWLYGALVGGALDVVVVAVLVVAWATMDMSGFDSDQQWE